MALIYVESFDDIANSTAQIQGKGWIDQNNFLDISAGNGRFGTNALRCPGSSAQSYRQMPSAYTSLIMGIAIWTNFGSCDLFGISDSGSLQLAVRGDANGRLYLTRGVTTIASGTTILTSSAYHFIELRAVIDDTVGTAKLVVDGVTQFDLTGLDTRNAGTTWNRVHLFRQSTTTYYDDIYLGDTSGGAPTNDLLGDCRVQCLFPSGNGNSSQFDGSDGNSTDNYLLVDEQAPDDDTTYVQTNVPTEKDTYAFGDLTPTAGTVYGVQISPYARKTDAGARSIATVARLAGTETDSANAALVPSYLYYPDIRETKPGGGVWTISDVNSAEFGVKVTV